MQKSRNQKSTLAPIHEIFPLEIIEMVLKNLDYESLSFARRTCRQWQKIIDNFKLLKTASCKYISINKFKYFSGAVVREQKKNSNTTTLRHRVTRIWKGGGLTALQKVGIDNRAYSSPTGQGQKKRKKHAA